MRINLEVLNRQTINYTDKKTQKPASFDVFNCREASPATCLLPFRLSARDFPTIAVPSIITFAPTGFRKGEKDDSVSLQGALVAAGAKN
jgi:hypothetical protein